MEPSKVRVYEEVELPSSFVSVATEIMKAAQGAMWHSTTYREWLKALFLELESLCLSVQLYLRQVTEHL